MNGQVTVGEAEKMVEGVGMVAEERNSYMQSRESVNGHN